MNISRSGYYKWVKNKNILNQYETDRQELSKLIIDIHNQKKSYGYKVFKDGVLLWTNIYRNTFFY